jgi:4-alpha-glucanotransferase
MDVMWFERNRGSFRAPTRWRRDAVSMTTTHDLPTSPDGGAATTSKSGVRLACRPRERSRNGRSIVAGCGRLHRGGHGGRSGAAAGRSSARRRRRPGSGGQLARTSDAGTPRRSAGLADQPNLPGTIDEHPNWRRRLEPPAAKLFDDPVVARRAATIVARRP